MRSPSAAADVPFFDIYGEAPRAVDLRFVHVERMRDRVDVHHGQVRPHRHAHLHQISLWSHGSGRYRFEQDEVDLPAAALTLMPAGVVHGFEVEARTDAIVISLSDGFRADCLRDVAEPVAAG
ncbi:AraC-like regulator, partial [Caulobacter sp. AP07]|uniref:AraC family ligand binding domain-containing protein n=1 Tax=Caulobacter sp. AP07 TaxID=1144304 RepID=UPI000271E852